MEPISSTEDSESNGARTSAGDGTAGIASAVPAASALGGTDAATQRLPAVGAAGAAQAVTAPVTAEPSTEVMGAAMPPPASRASAAVTPTLASAGRDRCPLCASPVAPDQRYCVECGQRLAGARPTLMNDPALATTTLPSSAPPRKSRFDLGPNGTLIAGIATLLLALGVGILIGHYSASNTSSKKPTQVVVTGLGATGALGATAETPATAGASGAAGATSGSTKPTSGGSASGGSAHPSAATSKPSNPTVQVGQKGHGQGYQHGEFTGHFFGNENEEDAGAEGEEESSSAKGKSK